MSTGLKRKKQLSRSDISGCSSDFPFAISSSSSSIENEKQSSPAVLSNGYKLDREERVYSICWRNVGVYIHLNLHEAIKNSLPSLLTPSPVVKMSLAHSVQMHPKKKNFRLFSSFLKVLYILSVGVDQAANPHNTQNIANK